MERIQSFIYFQIVRFSKILPEKSSIKSFRDCVQRSVEKGRRRSLRKMKEEFPRNFDGKRMLQRSLSSFEGFIADENVVDWLYLVSKYPRRASLPLIFTYLEKNIDDKILEHIENHCDNLSSIKIMKRS